MIEGARLAYRTHGTLAPDRDNAILFAHMYSGTQASLDSWIGAGRPLDPERWFVDLPRAARQRRLVLAEHDRGPVPRS